MSASPLFTVTFVLVLYFLGFSYGFRPERGQHDALDALVVGITTKKVYFILDADSCFEVFRTDVMQERGCCAPRRPAALEHDSDQISDKHDRPVRTRG